MRRIRWTNEAILGLASLSEREQSILFERFELLIQFPLMYPARQRGRFAGLRYFALGGRWIVYYRPSETDVLVFNLVPALARPR